MKKCYSDLNFTTIVPNYVDILVLGIELKL